MAKKIALIVLAFALAAAVIFTGCAPARRPMAPNQYDNRGTQTGYENTDLNRNYDNYTKVGDQLGIRDWENNYRTDMYNGNMNNNGDTGTRRADDIAAACEQVQGVENATAVVTGNTAYIGIDLDDNTVVANQRDIKNEVAQKVRAANNDINTVYVSTEADFMNRLRNIGNGLRTGRPVDAFTTELNELIQRVTPSRW